MRRSLATDGGPFGSWRDFLDALPDATCVVDELGRIVFANRRLHDLTGYAVGSLEGRSIEVLVPEALRAEHRRAVRQYTAAPAPRQMGAGRKTACRRADGSTLAVDIALSPLPHHGSSWTVASIRDDSERQRTEEELFRAATHDALTGLANRGLLMDRLERIWRRRATQRGPLTVLFVDLDHFKTVNDADGHAAGDEVLRAVAGALEATFRPADTVARVGGDEFVIVCEDTPIHEAASLAARALDAVRHAVRELSFESAGGVTASVGVVAAEPEELADKAIDRADAAMYRAKRRGGDRVVLA